MDLPETYNNSQVFIFKVGNGGCITLNALLDFDVFKVLV
jgi:hypothetical protein